MFFCQKTESQVNYGKVMKFEVKRFSGAEDCPGLYRANKIS